MGPPLVTCSPRSSEVEIQGSRVTLDLLCLLPLLSAPVPQGKLISCPKQILSPSVHGHHTSVTAMTEGFTCFWRASRDASTVVFDQCGLSELFHALCTQGGKFLTFGPE